MTDKNTFTRFITLKDKKYFQIENGIWTGSEPPLIKTPILRNTNFNDNGYFDYSKVAEIEIEEKQIPRKSLKKYDILIERSGGGPNTPVGRASLYDKEDNLYSFSNFTSRIRIISEEVDPGFIHLQLLHLHWNKHTEKIQTQTTNIRNLQFDKYTKIKLLLPNSKTDQIRISSAIKSKLVKVEQMRQAALQQKEAVEALQGALLREVFPYKEGDELPKGWKWEKLEKIFEEVKNQVQPYEDEFKTLPFVGLENIVSHTREYTDEEYNPPASTCFKFDETNILYGKLRPYLNKVFLPTSRGKSSMELIPLKTKNNYSREFLAAVLQSEAVIGDTVKFSTGGRMPRADLKKLKKLEIAIPSDVSVCNQLGLSVSNKIKEIIELNKKANKQLEAIEALPAAILREVFEFKTN